MMMMRVVAILSCAAMFACVDGKTPDCTEVDSGCFPQDTGAPVIDSGVGSDASDAGGDASDAGDASSAQDAPVD